MEEKNNGPDNILSDPIEVDDSVNQQINEENIQCAVQIYKRFIGLKAAEGVKGQEDNNYSNQLMKGFSLNESHTSQPGETPQFGTRIDQQNLPQFEMNREEPNLNSNITKNCWQIEHQNRQVQIKQITDDAEKQQQIKTRLFPLYGIDHSKQFFHDCPDLSVLLTKCKDFIRAYCSEQISSTNFKEGCSFKDGLALSGPELKQLGRAVFRNVFRRMEQYIFNICKKNIVKIPEKDVLQIAEFLLDENSLEQDHIEILKKFMKLSFDIPAQITENQVIQIYTTLMRWLNQKNEFDIFQFDYSQSISKPRFVWNREKQIKFCQEYQSNKSLSKVLEVINSDNLQPKATILDLRCKLAQLIKSTIRKIEAEFRKYEKKQAWIQLFQRDFKSLVRDPKALPLRILLLKINIKKYVFLEEIKKIVMELDSFFNQKNKKKYPNKILFTNYKKKVTSDSSSSDDKDQEQQSSQPQQPEEQLVANKNNKQKTNHAENTTWKKQYKQTLFTCFEKNLQKPKEQPKRVPSIQNGSSKNIVSQLDKYSSNFKSKPKHK